MKTKNNLTEKKLTKAELEAREKVMKDLKKNKSALVKRYGKDAEAVMYGRATNIAKKMAESENKNRIKELVRKALMQEQDIEVGADKYEGEQELSKVSAIMDDLEDKLKHHDWWYMMSDDHRYYMSGSAQSASIRGDVKTLTDLGYGKEAKELYNKYAPDQLKLTEAKGKDLDKDGDIDSDDYLAARDAAIKKAKGELKEFLAPEDLVRSLQKQGVKIDLQEPYNYKDIKDALEALGLAGKYDDLMPQNYSVEWPEYPKDMYTEDIDLGHEDNEPHMIKGELYQIGKYAMELYAVLEELEEAGGEYDFPAWWQAKITTAKENLDGAKHYLEFEMNEPKIDAAVDALTGEEPHMGEPEPPMMEDIFSGRNDMISSNSDDDDMRIDRLAAKLYKLKNHIQPAFFQKLRKLINLGELEKAEFYLDRIQDYGDRKDKEFADMKGELNALGEGLPKGFWDKKMKAKDETNESYETLKKKIQGQGKSAKAAAAIAGAVAAYKAKGGGKGPTAKQKK